MVTVAADVTINLNDRILDDSNVMSSSSLSSSSQSNLSVAVDYESFSKFFNNINLQMNGSFLKIDELQVSLNRVLQTVGTIIEDIKNILHDKEKNFETNFTLDFISGNKKPSEEFSSKLDATIYDIKQGLKKLNFWYLDVQDKILNIIEHSINYNDIKLKLQNLFESINLKNLTGLDENVTKIAKSKKNVAKKMSTLKMRLLVEENSIKSLISILYQQFSALNNNSIIITRNNKSEILNLENLGKKIDELYNFEKNQNPLVNVQNLISQVIKDNFIDLSWSKNVISTGFLLPQQQQQQQQGPQLSNLQQMLKTQKKDNDLNVVLIFNKMLKNGFVNISKTRDNVEEMIKEGDLSFSNNENEELKNKYNKLKVEILNNTLENIFNKMQDVLIKKKSIEDLITNRSMLKKNLNFLGKKILTENEKKEENKLKNLLNEFTTAIDEMMQINVIGGGGGSGSEEEKETEMEY